MDKTYVGSVEAVAGQTGAVERHSPGRRVDCESSVRRHGDVIDEEVVVDARHVRPLHVAAHHRRYVDVRPELETHT